MSKNEGRAESGCGDSDLSGCQRLLSKPLNVSFWPPDTRFAGQPQLKIAANLELLRGLLPPDSSPIFGGRAVTIGDATCGERKTSVKYQDTGGEIPAVRAESPFPPSTKELNPVSHTAECCCSLCVAPFTSSTYYILNAFLLQLGALRVTHHQKKLGTRSY